MQVLSVCRTGADGNCSEKGSDEGLLGPNSGGVRVTRMRSVRWASMAAVAIATVAASWMPATSAAALEIGPVSVPVTLPTVGPVVVAAPSVAPDLGVTATVSPATGASVAITTPSALGPIALPAGASSSIQVALGANPAPVAVGPVAVGSVAGAPVVTQRAAAVVDRARAAAPVSSPGRGPTAAVHAGAGSASPAGAPVHRVARSRPTAVDNPAAVVNASLRHSAPGGVGNLWRAVAATRWLWLALLLIALVARWAVGGFLLDALRRARAVNPA